VHQLGEPRVAAPERADGGARVALSLFQRARLHRQPQHPVQRGAAGQHQPVPPRRAQPLHVEAVRLRRLALRPQLEIGLADQAYISANLRLTMWSFDDSLRPVRGQPTTVLVRDNGLDTKASAMLDAVKTFRPNLVKS